jgi:DmsE family decaheme c-type cytochrome
MLIGRLSMPAVIAVLTVLFLFITYGAAVRSTEDDYLEGYTGADAELVGSESCLMCHSDYTPDNMFTHVSLIDGNPDNADYGYGCEGCHGPGGNHMGDVSGIINPPMLSNDDLTELCSKCHDDLRTYSEEDWFLGEHYLSDTTCLACHSGHSSNDDFLIDESVEELCYTCHSQARAEFSLRSHHPVDEEQMGCVSCHNPHSGRYEYLLVEEGDDLCFTCHADKEGPFVYDHPVSTAAGGDGCRTCHLVHGSNTDSLLRLPHRLCEQCHTEQTPENHFAGTCWSSGCHVDIHGSNSHPLFFD